MLLADERIQTHLPLQHSLAYMNLLAHASMLNATTGSAYVDGEFSRDTAVKRVRNLTGEAIQAMVEAELVQRVDGDTFRIEFTGRQTSHEGLQAGAEANAARSAAQRENRAAANAEKQEAEEKAASKRKQSADRSQRHRDKRAETPVDLDQVEEIVHEDSTAQDYAPDEGGTFDPPATAETPDTDEWGMPKTPKEKPLCMGCEENPQQAAALCSPCFTVFEETRREGETIPEWVSRRNGDFPPDWREMQEDELAVTR